MDMLDTKKCDPLSVREICREFREKTAKDNAQGDYNVERR